MTLVGATYLERGRPVTVLVQWRSGRGRGPAGPRNVLIRRGDGELVVRPFRGLRRVSDAGASPTRPVERGS
jgi:acetyl esterase